MSRLPVIFTHPIIDPVNTHTRIFERRKHHAENEHHICKAETKLGNWLILNGAYTPEIAKNMRETSKTIAMNRQLEKNDG